MFRGFKNWVKSFLTLSKFEQRGAIVLVALIAIVSAVNFFVPLTLHHKNYSSKEFKAEVLRFAAARERLVDSLKIVKLQNEKKLTFEQAQAKLHPFLFDPNHLTREEGTKLGLTLRQIKQIQHYIKKGGKFRRKEDFKKMYCLSEVEYKILAPYIDLPTSSNNIIRKSKDRVKINPAPGSIKINTCDTSQLINKLHIEPWIAERIIKYRKLLGNFYSVEQLKEVYGLKKPVFDSIKKYLICDSSLVKKINLNQASFKTLVHHPYLSYKITEGIVNSRRNVGQFSNIIELKSIPGVTDSIYQKIKHYVYVSK